MTDQITKLLDMFESRANRPLGDEPDPKSDGQEYYNMWIDHQRDMATESQQDSLTMAKTLRAVLELLSAVEEDPSNKLSVMYGGEPFPAMVTTNEVRQAITDALETDDA